MMHLGWKGCLGGLALMAIGLTAAVPGADHNAPAKFKVTSTVVNPGVGPFSATIGAVGNSLMNFSFEPIEFRTRLFAEEDAPDKIVVNPRALTHYDSLREGFYDGAEVRVYRIINEKMQLVRRDRVACSHMSGWLPHGGQTELIDPTETRHEICFDDWNRRDVPYYFTLKAVGHNGVESAAAPVVRIVNSGTDEKPQPKAARTVPFKQDKRITDTAPPAAPSDFKGQWDAKRGVIVFTWKAVPDVAGYRLFRSDYPPEEHKGFELVLAGKATDSLQHIKRNDWVVVAKPISEPSRKRLLSNRVWGASQTYRNLLPPGLDFFPDEDPAKTWQYERYPTSWPVPELGQTAVKVSLKEGQVFRLAQYNHAGTGQSWYEVLKPGQSYTVEVWLKQQGMADPTFTFSFSGFYSKKIEPIVFKADGQWKHYRATFTPPVLWEGSGGVGQMVFEFKGPGTVWIDNLRVYSDEAPFLDYLPYQYEALKRSGMNCLRTHGFIKTGTFTYNMEQLTNARGASSGIRKENTLEQILGIMRRAKVAPWLQIEMHMSPEEWLGFIEYLAAPYDPAKDSPQSKPWAYKRFSQGQAKPWADEFDTIYFELSNETWNWLFNPWVFESMTDAATGVKYDRGEVYGFFQEHVYDCLARSPYWNSAGLDKKMHLVIGGWAVNKYGTLAASRSPHSRYLTIAAYNGGWDEGEGPTAGDDPSLFRVLLQVPQTSTPRAEQLQADRDQLRRQVNTLLEIGTYEAGPGYALSGLNKQPKMSAEQVAAQERTMKSLAGGTATLDSFLDKAVHGLTLQNFFTYFHGRTHWVSHTAWYKGGRPHPCWLALELFNREGTGDFLRVDTLQVPAIDVEAFKHRKAVKDAPLVACYATGRGDRVNLFLLSRKLDNYPKRGDHGYTPVTIELPFSSAKKITLYKIAGDPRATNIDAENVKIETVPIAATAFANPFVVNDRTGADPRGLPPAATLLYVFEGVSP